jgi:hypothetical protein
MRTTSRCRRRRRRHRRTARRHRHPAVFRCAARASAAARAGRCAAPVVAAELPRFRRSASSKSIPTSARAATSCHQRRQSANRVLMARRRDPDRTAVSAVHAAVVEAVAVQEIAARAVRMASEVSGANAVAVGVAVDAAAAAGARAGLNRSHPRPRTTFRGPCRDRHRSVTSLRRPPFPLHRRSTRCPRQKPSQESPSGRG